MHNEPRVPNDKARRILERAAQIDGQHADLTSIAALRHAASEAGIAPEAFEEAVRELDDALQASSPGPSRRRFVIVGAAGVAAALLGIAFYSGTRTPSDLAVHSPPDTPLAIQRH